MIYLVTRHLGAKQWLAANYPLPFTHLTHLPSIDLIAAEDSVIGNLPIHLVAQLCAKGARYFHLQFSLPEQLRGQELSAAQLEEFSATLVEYHAHCPISDEAILASYMEVTDE